MMDSTVMPLVYSILVLVMVMSGLLAYRQPVGTMIKQALVWVVIFAAAFLIISLIASYSGQ